MEYEKKALCRRADKQTGQADSGQDAISVLYFFLAMNRTHDCINSSSEGQNGSHFCITTMEGGDQVSTMTEFEGYCYL